MIPWKLFWVVMFTGDEVRRAATGWGALGVQSEPQGLKFKYIDKMYFMKWKDSRT